MEFIIEQKNYDDITAIVMSQNLKLLKLICKKYHWNYAEMRSILYDG
jgi:hypothetical protein